MAKSERPFRGTYYRSLDEALVRARARDEVAIEAALPIVDPHHHFMDGVRGQYLLADFDRDIASGHRVEQTIFIDSGAAYRHDALPGFEAVSETAWVADLVAPLPANTIAAGIVAHIDLDLGDRIEPIATAHLEAAAGRLRGVRDLVQHEPGSIGTFSTRQPRPGRMGENDFRQGIRCLGRLGLSFDLWAFHPQLDEVAALAKACPDTVIILNHIGTPLGVGPYSSQTSAVRATWRDTMRDLARYPNVRVKLGGLGMPYTGFNFLFPDAAPRSDELAEAWHPLIETSVELFGPTRCMFESNFPADAQTCGYGTLWNAFKRITRGWSASERSALFSETARTTYRLDAPSDRPAVA